MSQIICVEIEHSENFVSNGAKKRLKRDIKQSININPENINLDSSKYVNSGFDVKVDKVEGKNNYWKATIVKNEQFMRKQIAMERKNKLRLKLKQIKRNRSRTQVTKISELNKNKEISEELLNAYKQIKKKNSMYNIESPDVILKNKDFYKNEYIKMALQLVKQGDNSKTAHLKTYISEVLKACGVNLPIFN